MIGRRAALASLLAATAALWPAGPAGAQSDAPTADHDYDIESRTWNGLATFAALARGSGLTVVSRTRIDWDEIGAGDLLFVVYPTARLDPAHLDSFVRGGGRLLIADDFGASSEALRRLGVRLEQVRAVAAARYHDELPFAPMAIPSDPSHPLAQGVAELATNHPAVFADVGGVAEVFSFGDEQVVVAAGQREAGLFVALSDPSVLINRMMQFEGNLQFAINLLRYLVDPDRTTRIVILSGQLRLRGEPQRLVDEGTALGLLSDFNRWLRELNEYVFMAETLRALVLLLALLAIFALRRALSSARSAVLDGSWTRAGSPHQPLDYESSLSQLDRGRNRSSFEFPAAILRDTVNDRLAAALSIADPLFSLKEVELYSALAQARGHDAATALRLLYPWLRQLPTRGQAASPWEPHYVSRPEFERLYAHAAQLYRTLEGTTAR